VDHGYGYTSPTYQDSVVIFEKRADAVFYASLIAVQGAAPFEVASVDPRRVIVSAVTTGCKLSFNAAGSLLRPPSEGAGGDQSEEGLASSSERPWLPYGRGVVGGDAESIKSYKLTREDTSKAWPTAAEAREKSRQQKDKDDDLREEAAWGSSEMVGKLRELLNGRLVPKP